MALMEWNASLSTGIKRFDNDHRRLVDMVNNLHDAMKAGMGNHVVGEILDQLVNYTGQHFASEESQMRLHNYPEYMAHKKLHDALVAQVADIRKQFVQGTALPSNLLEFLKKWLTLHIMGEDKKYGPFLASKGLM
ncbi:bacteriohemerythrin [Geobacter sp. SVR]|uniref:bacteriohemerythrin n=1 Tax=Geobacter sp. SVR TaxID=2495594 RepID=UPI00143EFAD2|nr:bacteriohemerythrin [Geobacter sp. SVR]BCS53530.1 hemerythrin [Geobacter sp. SVR]GCF84273.1 hemerythrin [Geobacter sp. SVR]